jgi:hypothetical protein
MANPLFASKDFKPELLASFFQRIPNLEEKKLIISNWQKAIANGKVQRSKEEQIKSEFLDKFFGQVLGYTYESHEAEWNLEKEFKSISDNKKPDAALGFFDQQGKADVRCVIEVKGGLVNLDKKQNRVDFTGSPVDQAFSYVPRMPGKCEWVIVTNMIEIRFYSRNDIGRYETFLIPELLQPNNLQKFFFLLSFNQLFLERLEAPIDKIFSNRQAEQKKIGAEFYNQYKDIRLILFANLFKENSKVKPKDLFRVTQKLIDRLIFIGFVRDLRLVDNVLTELNQNIKTSFRKDNQKAWGELKELFNALNEGYTERNIPPFNGELFKPDVLLDNLTVRDNQIMPLVKLIQEYDFQSQLDVNILGHIFEQSIADLPEILDEIQKKTPLELSELKPESTAVTKRKKDGIFYTPDYITHYMVKEAVGGWLEDRKKEILEALKIEELPEPEFADYATIKIVNDNVEANETILLNLQYWKAYEEKLASIKVVDPACGSGAFLNSVFDFLYNEWAKVVKPEIKKLSTPLDKQMLENSTVNEPLAFTYSGGEEWRLKKDIILHNIYGVDLNGESVEITKLSLWLKTANKTNSLAALYDNIKQGNSLIDDAKVAGDDAFDWHKAFPEIMKAGGFDVVVGNPPYVRQELMKDISEFLEKNYKSYSGKADLYVYFFEKGIKILNKQGRLIFITSGKFIEANYGKPLLDLLTTSSCIVDTIDFGDLNVFEDISAYPMITHLKKEVTDENFIRYTKIDDLDFSDLSQKMEFIGSTIIDQKDFIKNDFKFINEKQSNLLKKIYSDSSTIEKTFGLPLVGIKTGFNDGYLTELPIGDHVRDYVFGKDVKRYAPVHSENRIIFPYKFGEKYELINLKETLILSELKKNKSKLESRAIIKEGLVSKTKVWYEYQQINKTLDFDHEVIVYPNVSLGTNFALTKNAVVDMTAFIINSNNKYLLAILNSKLTDYLMNQFAISRRGGYLEYKVQYIEKIPIKEISKKDQQPFIALAEKMLELNKSTFEQAQKFIDLLKANFVFEPTTKLKKWYEIEFIDVLHELEKGGAKIPTKKQTEWLEIFKTEKDKIKHTQQEIAKTDKEIDELVYQLYGLTAEEKAIVEKA